MSAIKVLVVVDGIFNLKTTPAAGSGFVDPTDSSFTIATFINVLRGSPSPKFNVDTAHRNDDPNATIPGKFDFASTLPDLSVYDVICLFGYDGSNYMGSGLLNFLDDKELAAISQFMDGGGGVLATGDHDGLGSLMCGKIPRVRSMRKWFAPSDNDASIPAAAPRNWPGGGPNRADTLQPDHNGQFNFDNQSDDVAQPLSLPLGSTHPILQGANGPITAFPDHMHEGEVIEPWSLTDTLTFDGKMFTEYPTFAGHREKPRVIATGNVIGGHGTPVEGSACEQQNFVSVLAPTVAKTIGILCVYDGHKARVGRVVTDSSFHHYLDLNVVGDPCGVDYKQLGFTNTPMFADLKAFFVNTVKWLSRAIPSISPPFIAHDLDPAWLLELWLMIHGPDPGPLERRTMQNEEVRQLAAIRAMTALSRTLGDAKSEREVAAVLAPLAARLEKEIAGHS